MASIGNSPTQQAFTPAIDYFSGNGSTTAFTLSRPVASVAQVQVTIDNVAQNPSSAYTVSANTITFTSAPLSGTNNIYVYYTSPITQVIAPGQGTVTATSFVSSTGTGAGVFQTSPTINTPTLASANITTALTLTGASGTSGQALTSGGSGVAPTWTTIGASAATPTALGTVYGKTDTSQQACLGYQAGNSSSGNAIVAVGYRTLYVAGVANNTTALGYQAGIAVTSGGENVLVGENCASTLTTGANNIIIGSNAQNSSSGVSHEIVIGKNANGKGGSTGFISPNGGGVYQGNNSSTWAQTSDQRLKKNIVDYTEGLNKIIGIQVRNFEYRTEDEITELPKNQAIKKEGVQLGVIAQELQQILPDCVKTETTGVMSVNQESITWHLINAIKDLKALNDTQAETINALTARIVALENR